MYDVIIIGGGPAGLSAATWCDELGLDTLLLESKSEIGGQLSLIHNPINNYLGARFDSGDTLRAAIAESVADADFDLWTQVTIESVDLAARRILLASGEQLQAITIVIATGVRRRKLGISGESEFAGRGMIESGTRDRSQFAGDDVCVVGGGDAAAENALLLAELCPTVTVVCRSRKLKARREFVEQLQTNHRVTVFTESNVTKILGNDRVEAVEILRGGALKPFQMAVRGVLVRIGVEPNTEMFRGQLRLDEKNYIVASSEQETSIANVFAAGDVANPLAPTISSASGTGATAAKVIASRLQPGNRTV